MATKQQIDLLTQLFAEARPAQMNAWPQRNTNLGNEGMLGVLLYLYRTDGTVTAGMISKFMNITTGRVSVLIQKMVDKGLIIRETGKEDARVAELRLTDKGRQVIEELQQKRTAQMEQLIDTVGMERLKEYIEISREVWAILTPISLDL